MSSSEGIALHNINVTVVSSNEAANQAKNGAESNPTTTTVSYAGTEAKFASAENENPGCIDKLFPQRDEGIFFGVRLFSHSLKPRRLTKFERLITFCQISAAIVTSLMSILSFSRLFSTTKLLTDFARNISTAPLVDIQISTGVPLVCPHGYSSLVRIPIDYTPADGPKVKTTLRTWRSALICGKRDSNYGTALTRRRNTGSGCPSGFTTCGASDVCVPDGADCPIASITVEQTSSADSDPNVWDFDDDWYKLTFTRVNNAGEVPLLNFAMNLDQNMCYGMIENSSPEICEPDEIDTRWSSVDFYDIVKSVPDYPINTDIYLFQRSEIEWNEDVCPESRRDAYDMVPPLREVPNTQLSNMIISIFGSLINIYYAYRIYKERTDDDESNDNQSEAYHTMASISVNVMTLGMSIYAYSKARVAQNFISNVSNNPGCTDAITYKVFNATKSSVDGSTGFNFAVVILRGLWLLYNIVDYFVLTRRVKTINVATAPIRGTGAASDA